MIPPIPLLAHRLLYRLCAPKRIGGLLKGLLNMITYLIAVLIWGAFATILINKGAN